MKIRTRSKYGAKRTEVDGHVFASQKEARRYGELKLLEKAGEISELTLQPAFALHATAADTKRTYQVGWYKADFSYVDMRGEGNFPLVVEDVKGFRTPLYRWKKKHVEAQYRVTIREV